MVGFGACVGKQAPPLCRCAAAVFSRRESYDAAALALAVFGREAGAWCLGGCFVAGWVIVGTHSRDTCYVRLPEFPA